MKSLLALAAIAASISAYAQPAITGCNGAKNSSNCQVSTPGGSNAHAGQGQSQSTQNSGNNTATGGAGGKGGRSSSSSVATGGAGGQGGQGGKGGQGGVGHGGTGGTSNATGGASNSTSNAAGGSSKQTQSATSNSGGNTLSSGGNTQSQTNAGNNAAQAVHLNEAVQHRAPVNTAYAPHGGGPRVTCRIFMGIGGSGSNASLSGGVPIGNDQTCLSDVGLNMMDRANQLVPGTFTAADYLRQICKVEGMEGTDGCNKLAPATPVGQRVSSTGDVGTTNHMGVMVR